MIIAWKNSFSIDEGVIDADHIFLIELMNDILGMIANKAAAVSVADKLINLKLFAEQHFKREEALQIAAEYPDHDLHVSLHKELIDDLVNNIRHLSENSRFSDENNGQYLKDAKRFMTRWLISHIINEDAKMKPYVSAMRWKADSMQPIALMAGR